MRVTIRFNEKEKAELDYLKAFIHEEDISKIVKFAVSTALHHVKTVTNLLVTPEWDVIFQRKRKTQKLERKLY